MERKRGSHQSRSGVRGGMKPGKGGAKASGGGRGQGSARGSAKGPASGGAKGPAKGGAKPPAGGRPGTPPAKGAPRGGPARGGPARGPASGRGGRGSGGGPPRPSAPRGLGGDQVEGRQAVRELLLAGRRKVRELWVATDVDDSGVMADILDLAAANRVPVVEVNRRRLEAEAASEAPQGVLAKAAPLQEADLDALARTPRGGPAPFLVAVDGVTDPGNFGALLRSAEGAGVTGVVVPRHRAVHVTPTVAKAAAGAVEHLPIAVVPGLPTALRMLSEQGLWVVGLDDAADRSLFDLGDLAAEPVVLVLGAEGPGLSRLVRERCDVVVAIPMLGQLSSLNVSAAAALACFEVARHRVAPG